jgi:hypothetical protein
MKKCECGCKVDDRATTFVTPYKLVCPNCGNIYYIDKEPIDFKRIVKVKGDV